MPPDTIGHDMSFRTASEMSNGEIYWSFYLLQTDTCSHIYIPPSAVIEIAITCAGVYKFAKGLGI